MKLFMPAPRRTSTQQLSEAGEPKPEFFKKHSGGPAEVQYCNRPAVLKRVLRADPKTMNWLVGLMKRREEGGYLQFNLLSAQVEQVLLNVLMYAGKQVDSGHSTIKHIYDDPELRAGFEREFLRGCQIITSDERGKQGAFSIYLHFPHNAEIKILVAACGVPTDCGSPIVDAISEKFPKSKIIATDISFPYQNFYRPPNATFLVHNLVTEPLPADHFDAIHCTHFLYYLTAQARLSVLEKLVRAVKDNGLIVTETGYSKELREFAAAQGKKLFIEHPNI